MGGLDIEGLALESFDSSIRVIDGLCVYYKAHKDFPKLLKTARRALSDTRNIINSFSDQCIRDKDVRRIINTNKRKFERVEDDLEEVREKISRMSKARRALCIQKNMEELEGITCRISG